MPESGPSTTDLKAPAQPPRLALFVKRAIDLLLAGGGLLLLWPILFVCALAVRRQMGAPVFFRQIRPGRYGRPFTLLKLRTMNQAVDAADRPLADAERLTPLGRWLRRTSLDELPQLWNIVRGEMSLVGPRPLLLEYLPLYSPEQMRRHAMPPGLTGWAQINGRNALDWPERLALDVWYVDNWSLGLDVRILFHTFWKVLRREGINAPGRATVEPFRGNPSASQKAP